MNMDLTSDLSQSILSFAHIHCTRISDGILQNMVSSPVHCYLLVTSLPIPPCALKFTCVKHITRKPNIAINKMEMALSNKRQ